MLSSFSLYGFRVGGGTFDYQSFSQPMELIGYYPLLLYSNKSNIIPETLNRNILPPLVLQKSTDFSEFVHFMGNTLSAKNANQHFSLKDVKVSKDLPEVSYTFHLTYDMITQNDINQFFPDTKFHLFTFYFKYKKSKEELKRYQFDVKVIFENILSSTSDKTKAPQGDFVIEILYSSVGFFRFQPMSELLDVIKVSKDPTNDSNKFQNVEDKMYKTFRTEKFNFSQLLSPQPLLFSVGFLVFSNRSGDL